jgi:hypothetical protein
VLVELLRDAARPGQGGGRDVAGAERRQPRAEAVADPLRLDEIRRVLRAGYHAARATGAVVSDYFLEATFLWTDQDGSAQRREKAFTITPPQLRALGMPVSDIA